MIFHLVVFVLYVDKITKMNTMTYFLNRLIESCWCCCFERSDCAAGVSCAARRAKLMFDVAEFPA